MGRIGLCRHAEVLAPYCSKMFSSLQCTMQVLESESLSSFCATAMEEKASDAASTANTNASVFRVVMMSLPTSFV